ncbi:MAG: SDR family oxidoreductase [Caldilineaceae bacterium]|nr:SDR family oxidoreductase [Caldilineaceae bacterium]
MKLAGKVALVTGAGRGLGRAYALHLAKLGADVVINDVNLNSAQEFNERLNAPTVMAEIAAMGRRSLGVQADVTDPDAVNGMFEEITGAFGRLDILVNNAGGNLRHQGADDSASGSPPERYQYIMDINLTSCILCCQAASRLMKEQASGKIVNVASQAGLWSGRNGGGMPYKIAKAGVAHYTRVLAAELGPFGVNVNCIAPGFIASSRTKSFWDQAGSDLTDQIALRRVGQPEEAAKVIEFLVTDLSDYVTGQCIPICGGYVAWG